MFNSIKRLTAIFLMGLLFISCRKDARRSINLNDVIETEPAIQKPVTVNVIDAIGGYYEALPFHYSETTKSYPAIIFIPGAGQFGNGGIDLPYILNDGIAQLLDEKKFPPSFTVNGKKYSMVVLTPQFKYYPSDFDITSFINYALKNYRIDKSRIYMAGLSMGGFVTSDFAAENTSIIAAAVPISGVLMTGNFNERCEKIASGGLPIWVFHNLDDPTITSVDPVRFVSVINNDHPFIPAKLTLFKAAYHDAWTQAINPAYKENNMNIYEWMLQYSK